MVTKNTLWSLFDVVSVNIGFWIAREVEVKTWDCFYSCHHREN